MKIVGNIEVCNRLLPSLNIPDSRRSQWSSLTIGKCPGSNAELFILYQSAQNKLGTKYKVKNNIERVFTRFVDDGKTTIRFKHPPHDIRIRCDSLQLKLFLRALKLVLGEKVPSKTLILSNITHKFKVPPIPKTKIVILSKAEYPVLNGFPKTVEILKINHSELKSVDDRILDLMYLKSLDLSHNNLTSLPEELGMFLFLECLYLSHNKLGEVPAQDPRWNWIDAYRLTKSLQVLDLSHNELHLLPKQISRMKKLSILKIERNQLSQLPSGLGNISTLKSLVAGYNKLRYLPGSIKRLRLDSLDLAPNSFDSANMRDVNNLGVLSLLECAARKVINYRLFYSAELIPRSLVFYLDNAHYCVCGSACFEVFMRKCVPLQLNHIANTVILSHEIDSIVPTDAFFCSHKCVNK